MQKYDFMRNTKILSRDRGPDRYDVAHYAILREDLMILM